MAQLLGDGYLNKARECVLQIQKLHFKAAAVKERTIKAPSGPKLDQYAKV